MKVRVTRNGNLVAEPITGADGVARIDQLVADNYDLALDGMPPDYDTSVVPASVRFGVFFPKDLAFDLPLTLKTGYMATFGDSDLSVPIPYRRTSLDTYLDNDPELTGFFGNFDVVNLAEPDTPVYPHAQADHHALPQVSAGLRDYPGMRFAFLRFGLNDIHSYLYYPSDEHVEAFRDAYSAVLDLVASTGTKPILCTIHGEKRQDMAGGRGVANQVIRALANPESYGAVLVESDFDYSSNRQWFAGNDSEQVHLDDEGMQHVADLTRAAILAYYTRGDYADQVAASN